MVPADVEADLQVGGMGVEGRRASGPWLHSGHRARPLARRMKAVSRPQAHGVSLCDHRRITPRPAAMDRTERFYKIELLIRNRGRRQLRGAARRAGGVARDAEARPAVPARAAGRADRLRPARQRLPLRRQHPRQRAHELPGLWFSDKEIHALLTMHQLIQGLEAEGVLGRHLQPLLDKLHGMLGSNDVAARELMQRVNIVAAARRPVNARFFELIGSALLERRRVASALLHARPRQRKPARGVAATADPLPQHLVPGRLVPPQRGPAPLCAGRRARSRPCCRSAPRTWRWPR